MNDAYLHINITGPAGAGKTCAMHLIGHHLQQLGFNLACYDAPLPYASEDPQPEQPVDMTDNWQGRSPQPWPVLVTVNGGGIEELLKVSIGHHALANAYRRVVAGPREGAQVSEQAVFIECVDDVVASLRASLDVALRYQQAAHRVGVAQRDTDLGAVPLHQQ